VALGQEHQDCARFGQRLSIDDQGWNHPGGIQLQVGCRFLFAPIEIQHFEVEGKPELDQHPVHSQACRSR
jgi:hypothetical protein